MMRKVVLVVGDFRHGADEVFELRKLGVRVFVAGLSTAAMRRELQARGVETIGLVRSRRAVADAAVEWLGAADAVLFTSGQWDGELRAVLEAERELAAADGRPVRPLLWRDDPRYGFLNSAAEWAAFVAGAERGHKDKDRQPGTGRASRAAAKGRNCA